MKKSGSLTKWEAGEILELLLFVIAVGIFFFFVPLKAQAQYQENPPVCYVNSHRSTGERICHGRSADISRVPTPHLELEDWLQHSNAETSQGPGVKE